VILSDIAVGVVLQARERARRFGLDFDLLVADAEALPFADASSTSSTSTTASTTSSDRPLPSPR
jgi:ubiquinone/menaquinone biosynthesis C-methylase UbiE